MAHRQGFVVPNAGDAIVGFRQAEPDAGDFSILGNGNYGVLAGCGCSVNVLTISISAGPNILVHDGVVVNLGTGLSVSVQPGAATDRFDLVGWDGDVFELLIGTPSDDAQFPEIPDGWTPLWAVYVPAGASSLTNANLTDKRRWFGHGARGAVGTDATFLLNQIDGATAFEVSGGGELKWNQNSVSLRYEEDPDRIVVDGGRTVFTGGFDALTDSTVVGDLDISGLLTASNHKRGAVDPSGASVPGVPGDQYSRTDTGQLYTYRTGGVGWAEVYADEYPPGTLVSSLLSGGDVTTHMVGWLPLDGTVYDAADSRLGRIPTLSSFNSWRSPKVGGGFQYTLPNMGGRFTMGATTPRQFGGSATKTLSTANLPSHSHFGGASTVSAGGGHTHAVTVEQGGSHQHSISGGSHSHSVNDPGHAHRANHGVNVPTNFIVTMWGGNNKLDGPIHDKSHTWTVDVMPWTTLDFSNITIPVSGAHSHVLTAHAGHSHNANASSHAGHTHPFPPEASVGQSQPFDVTPAHLTVVYYVKV